MQTNETKADIYQQITNQILESLEEVEAGGRLPWQSEVSELFLPVNIASKRTYRGVNVLALWVSGMRRGYTSELWGTFKQWKAIGASVRKGEKATPVVFWKPLDGGKESEERQSEQDELPASRGVVARGFWVFNAEQVDGFQSAQTERIPESARIEEAERFSRSLLAEIRQGMSFAFYKQDEDFVGIPTFTRFPDANDYYSVLLHELTHWTGAKHRLDRNLRGRFGTRSYAAEELVAELGAAFLCGQLGLNSTPRPDHASYIASWIELLQNDKKAVFTAAAKAQQAVDWMFGLSDAQRFSKSA